MLLGTAVEVFRDARVSVDVADLEMAFEDDSEFRFPSLRSTMRFHGHVSGRLLRPLDPDGEARLRERFEQVWPELVAVVRLPMLPPMRPTRNDVGIRTEDGRLHVEFDLIAEP